MSDTKILQFPHCVLVIFMTWICTFSKLGSEDLCLDYSFWQNTSNRCSSEPLVLRPGDGRTHAFLCNRTLDCFKTWSKTKGYCKSSSTEEDCNRKGNFFCKKSKTCIKQGTYWKLTRSTCTVRNFHDFSMMHILREINFEFLHFIKQMNKILSQKWQFLHF